MAGWAGQVAVITGGASGVGYGIATALAKAGARIVVADIEEVALEKAVPALRALGGDTRSHVTNVAEPESLAALRDHALSEFGRVDLLFNNAGVCTYNRMVDTTDRDWRWVIDVNLMGVVHGINAFLPTLLDQPGSSRIVNTASPAGLISSLPFQAPYAASKAAVISLSESLAAELAEMHASVKVSVILPGKIRSSISQCDRNNLFGEKKSFLSEEVRVYREFVAAEFVRDSLGPEEFGEDVLAAIADDRFFAASHGGSFRDMVAARNRRILDSAYPE